MRSSLLALFALSFCATNSVTASDGTTVTMVRGLRGSRRLQRLPRSLEILVALDRIGQFENGDLAFDDLTTSQEDSSLPPTWIVSLDGVDVGEVGSSKVLKIEENPPDFMLEGGMEVCLRIEQAAIEPNSAISDTTQSAVIGAPLTEEEDLVRESDNAASSNAAQSVVFGNSPASDEDDSSPTTVSDATQSAISGPTPSSDTAKIEGDASESTLGATSVSNEAVLSIFGPTPAAPAESTTAATEEEDEPTSISSIKVPIIFGTSTPPAPAELTPTVTDNEMPSDTLDIDISGPVSPSTPASMNSGSFASPMSKTDTIEPEGALSRFISDFTMEETEIALDPETNQGLSDTLLLDDLATRDSPPLLLASPIIDALNNDDGMSLLDPSNVDGAKEYSKQTQPEVKFMSSGITINPESAASSGDSVSSENNVRRNLRVFTREPCYKLKTSDFIWRNGVQTATIRFSLTLEESTVAEEREDALQPAFPTSDIPEPATAPDVIVSAPAPVFAQPRAPFFQSRDLFTPTARPTRSGPPSEAPSSSVVPSSSPSTLPSALPSTTSSPTTTISPSSSPSTGPTSIPSALPTTTVAPSVLPSSFPTAIPSAIPSILQSDSPSISAAPSISTAPSDLPSLAPSSSIAPSALPSDTPSAVPTRSIAPSVVPSAVPSVSPSKSVVPSSFPSAVPSLAPSDRPSFVPSEVPSAPPSDFPSVVPSSLASPSLSFASPSRFPSNFPTLVASSSPVSDAEEALEENSAVVVAAKFAAGGL